MVARRVELRYDPEDLSVIDVFFEGRPVWPSPSSSDATRTAASRRPHDQSQRRPGSTTSSWWRVAHDEATGTGSKVDFTQLASFEEHDDGAADNDEAADNDGAPQ